MTTTTNTERSELNIADWMTLERLLFGVILAIGAGVRFFGLAAQPLSPMEAANAWAAWLQASGLAGTVAAQSVDAPGSALLFSLQTFVFWLAGGGDATARLVPALAGLALVALPWFWRPWLGRTAALSVALLIAIDPWLVAFSRRADGASLVLLFFAIALTCLMRLSLPSIANHERNWAWAILAVSCGLFVIGGALAFSLIPILIFFVWSYGLPSLHPSDDEPAESNGGGPGALSLAALFAGGILLGSTAWFSYPQGLTNVGNSVADWTQQIVGVSGYPLGWALLRFVADNPLVSVLGIAGLVLLWKNSGPIIIGGVDDSDGRRQWAFFLTVWVLWGMVLLVLPGRDPSSLLAVQGALLLAAGHALAALIDAYPSDIDWTEALIVVAVAAVLLTSALFWMRILIVAPIFSGRVAAICLLIGAALLFLFAAYGVWAGWRYARWLGGLLLTLTLLVANLAGLVQLSQINGTATPDGLFDRVTHPEVRQLAADVATLSAHRIGDPGEIPMQVQRGGAIDPVLAWYLRDMRRLDWVLSPALDVDDPYAPLAVTMAADSEGTELTASIDGYLGGEYAKEVAWLPGMLTDAPIVVREPAEQSEAGQRLQESVDAYWSQRAQPLLRWLLFREVKTLSTPESVVLWAPAE